MLVCGGVWWDRQTDTPVSVVTAMEALDEVGVPGDVIDAFVDAFSAATHVTLMQLHRAGVSGRELIRVQRYLRQQTAQ